jgi:hypothetical protein
MDLLPVGFQLEDTIAANSFEVLPKALTQQIDIVARDAETGLGCIPTAFDQGDVLSAVETESAPGSDLAKPPIFMRNRSFYNRVLALEREFQG